MRGCRILLAITIAARIRGEALITRRKLVGGLITAAMWPYAVRAQQKPGVPRIGYLSTGSADSNGTFLAALKDGLRELGYIEGKDIVIDVRWAGTAASDFPKLAATLVRDKPSLIIGTCIPSTRAAKNATRSIPVVMSVDGDPVAAGLVASLGRPGGNVTGISTLFEELIPKWLELVTAAVPKVRDVAILSYPDNVADPYFSARFDEAAKRIGVKALRIEASSPGDIDRGFATIKNQGAGALVVMTEAFFVEHLQRFIPLADRYKLPAIYGYREFAEAGGLMSYGISYRDYYRRMARYVDLVLKGAKPADLPVEQPSKIELVVNLATARKLGLSMPSQLLVRAERVIE